MQQTLEQKADEMEMLTELGKKADKVTVIEQLAGKADKEDVQTELDKKVDKEEIEEILQQQIDSTNIVLELDKKADKETVAEELEKKANAEIMQEELNKKADAETVSDALALKADSETMQTELDKKADIATMTEELAKKSNISHTHNYAGSSTAGGVANSATKLNTARTIDGVPFDGSVNIVHFGVCSTAANIAEKTVALTGFVLAEGVRVAVYFANANTAGSPMLNINGTGAHYLVYRNGSYALTGQWESGDIVEFVYYNSHWIMLTTNAHRLTKARTIRTNLASTSSASFDGTADITPGVTGTLPIANGGTGATSASIALSNLGGFSKNGGTINGNVEINENLTVNKNMHVDWGLTVLGQVKEGSSLNSSSNVYTHTEGLNTHTYGQSGHTEGSYTIAGRDCHAEGSATFALDMSSHSEGAQTIAGTNLIFKVKSVDTSTNKITFDADYTDFPLSNLSDVKVNSIIGVFTNYPNTGHKFSIKSIGSDHIITEETIPNDKIIGKLCAVQNNYGSVRCSHSEGEQSISFGSGSHAEGYATIAYGNGTHSEGMCTKAIIASSHVEGYYSTASGNYSHAEGRETLASASASHSEGLETTASSVCSHAEGRLSTSSGSCSHAEGYSTTARDRKSVV